MKSVNLQELDKLVQAVQVLKGAQLQKVLSIDSILGFNFWKLKPIWLWVDMNPQAPTIMLTEDKIFKGSGATKPIGLFLRSHFVGGQLQSLQQRNPNDKIVDMVLQMEPGIGQIEIRLFPHGQNILVEYLDKKISWHKTKALKALDLESKNLTSSSRMVKSDRTEVELKKEWFERLQKNKKIELNLKFHPRPKSSEEPKGSQIKGVSVNKTPRATEALQERGQRLWNKVKLKKEKAIEKLNQDLILKTKVDWQGLGDWLKLNQSLDVPTQWRDQIDARQSFSWNIQNCYGKSKALAVKKTRTLLRLSDLKQDLTEHIAHEDLVTWMQTQAAVLQKKPVKVDFGARTRKLALGSTGDAYLGKSATDNLKLLRKARAWDIWLHVKDLPSAHCIIRRNKAAKVTQQQLNQVGVWLLTEGLKSQAKNALGQKFEILTTECRYVRPIKGDRVGRVNYSHEVRFLVQITENN